MFRKPKRKVQALRQKSSDDDDDEDRAGQPPQDAVGHAEDEEEPESTTRELLEEARKRVKPASSAAAAATTSSSKKNTGGIMHTYDTSKDKPVTAQDLVTSTAQHHPSSSSGSSSTAAAAPAPPNDGIFRDTQRNAFHAGPIRAAASVRVTARFDYQPDICKDYKETGFCGFGDTCIYLHDRGDTLTGWQLEQQWEQEQKAKREQQQREMQDYAAGKQQQKGGAPNNNNNNSNIAVEPDDGLPFACHLCREHFKHPVMTTCGHYFCEACIMNHVRNESEHCPICGKDTGSVFNQPTKLLAKKRKVLGVKESKADDSWEQYAKVLTSTGSS